ncbi:hypothetical protein [Serratia marcescens]|uniref:hypothetical protein n=1 Tax=Serratia marcescens TaxID=615 RepID=UPI000AE59FC2|nr:hypothetical protein [Serratia marcescens]
MRILPLPSLLNAAARHYFDKLLTGNHPGEEKLAYYRQMTAMTPRRYLNCCRLKYAQYIFVGDASHLNSAAGWV